ncbi:MAG: DnaA/Hda family protein [Pseudomonadota bacterium]
MTDQSDSQNDPMNAYRQSLKKRFGEAIFHSWMSDIAIAKNSNGEVELATASRMRRDTLLQRFKPGMHEEWNRHIAPVKKFSIALRRKDISDRLDGAAPRPPVGEAFRSPMSKDADKKSLGLNDLASPLDPRSTFESFAVDETNQLAHAAAKQVFVETTPHQLIYIHGPSGIGKTHLLHAIGHEWRKRFGEGTCAYLTHSSLINGCVDAVFSNSILSLHKDLLTQRLILIDDIHLLGGKNRTQQEVLNMVNAFISSGRQLVIAGEAPPGRLSEKDIHARLADRLAGGLAVPMEPGGVALRTDVLKMRTAKASMKCEIGDDAIDYVAANFPHSLREAIGALNQLLLTYGDKETVVGRAEAQSALRSRLVSGKRAGTLEDGIAAAADAFGISVEDMKGRAQPQRIAKARHAFVYVGREALKESFPRIAASLGRDHTTAMSSYRRAEALLERNKDFRDAVDAIRLAVGG